MSERKMPLSIRRAFREECVGVKLELGTVSWGGDRIKTAAETDLTVDQARSFAAALIEAADKADAKAAAKHAHEEHRRKWREREVAAGRMIILGSAGHEVRDA